MKNQRYKITFFTLLSLLLLSAIIFIILVTGSKKDTKAGGTAITTPTPTSLITPSPSPEPTAVPEKSVSLFPAYEDINGERKYGYIDKSGAFVISPSFDYADDFHDGVALVTMDEKNCIIDEEGTILFLSDHAIDEFSNGLASFSTFADDNTVLFGYIDSHGKEVIEAKYVIATKFREDGTAYVATERGKYALIDQTGKELETYELDEKYYYPYSLQDGYLIYEDSAFNYGVINVRGEEILKPIYPEILYLGNDLFAVKEPGMTDYMDQLLAKQAIFNSKGEQLSDYIYYDLTNYHDGYCSATDDNFTFFVGLDGQIAENLPKFEGKGTLKLFDDVITANIDREQFLASLDGTIIWQLPSTLTLSHTITVNSIKFKPNRNVLVRYPQIDGLKDINIQNEINYQLKSIFTDHRKNLSKEEYISVEDSFTADLINNLLIIGRHGYDYTGGAHGMPIMDYFHIDIRTGTFYQLKDLFLTDKDYISKINGMIMDEINSSSDNAIYFTDSFTGISESQYFRLKKDAIIIYFYPYEIAPYAAGFPEFIIPFKDIMEFIDTDGAFWNSFQGSN